ncbi:30S ribosomal protein S4e [Candidatus Woesearchaeota archaeon]|nr:30S ribosomal protein S4e [Candidatus Woesearchaeota archaeon]
MGKDHLSRIAVPKTWPIKRRMGKWAVRPKPGMHAMKIGMPLNMILRDVLCYAKTTKEVKSILNNQEVLIDGKKRKDVRFIAGLMDVLSLSKTKEHFRILLNKKGKIFLVPIESAEAKFKLCKIKNKRMVDGKIQLNLHDGRNILAEDKKYKTGDTVAIELPSQKVMDVIAFEKGAVVYLVSGKHVGSSGVLQEIKNNRVIVKTKEGVFETSSDYAFVIGKEKSLIKLEK